MATTQELIDSLKQDKINLANMLNSMGVEASPNETFTSLTPKVGKIVTDPILQDKSITIKENGTQTITADEGYDGLNNVEVTTDITSSGGGETPAVGFVVNEFDANGYPLDITVVGRTTIGARMFKGHQSGTSYYGAFSKTKKFTLPNNLTAINIEAFNMCIALEEINFPDTLETIGDSGLSNCKGITQASLKGIKSLGSNSFSNCLGLKAVWLGSSLTTTNRYTFRYCSGLTKIFIDKPRVEVEALTGYSYAFMDKAANVGIIVCNDDEGFITKEEFDATTW